jgi:EAL domain-containing protein (putative c-di-GMP-specific phosphodiesterase class I)
LIVDIGRWAMYSASRQFVSMLERKIVNADVTMAVNMSAKQLCDTGFIDEVEELIKNTGIRPGNLELELTESMLMENIEAAAKALAYLKRRGVLVSVDDFGTGYSSLSYLKKLPVHLVKIDRSFVKDIPQDQEDMDIVAAIVVMTHRINYKVIAEGIETQEQFDFLKACGCNLGQGYLISKPLPAQLLEQFCSEWNQRQVQYGHG